MKFRDINQILCFLGQEVPIKHVHFHLTEQEQGLPDLRVGNHGHEKVRFLVNRGLNHRHEAFFSASLKHKLGGLSHPQTFSVNSPEGDIVSLDRQITEEQLEVKSGASSRRNSSSNSVY